jgi:hypothetical protein
VFDLNQNHFANVSKDRTSLFDGKDFFITEETGQELIGWLDSGETKEKIEAERIANLKEKIKEILKNSIIPEEEKNKVLAGINNGATVNQLNNTIKWIRTRETQLNEIPVEEEHNV